MVLETVNEVTTLTATNCNETLIYRSNGSIVSPINVGVGTYTATCKNDCGNSSGNSNSITIVNTPIDPTCPSRLSISANLTVPQNQPATISATGCTGTLTWDDATHSSNRSVSTPNVGQTTYTARCQHADGCGENKSVTVTVTVVIPPCTSPSPPTITAAKTSLLVNEVTTLTATNCNETLIYRSNGSIVSPINVGVGTYTATCENNCGFSGNSNSITIVNTPVDPTCPSRLSISADLTTVPQNQPATISATGCTGRGFHNICAKIYGL